MYALKTQMLTEHYSENDHIFAGLWSEYEMKLHIYPIWLINNAYTHICREEAVLCKSSLKSLGAFFLIPSEYFFENLLHFMRKTWKREIYVIKRWKSKVWYLPQIAESILSIYRRKIERYVFNAKKVLYEHCIWRKPTFWKNAFELEEK